MKKYYSLVISCVLLTTILIFDSCSSPEEAPSNVIEDGSGINIDLDWTTGGSVLDALHNADFDLALRKGGTVVLSSASFSQFERITLDSELYADGVYTVTITLFSATADVTYTATVNGITVSKPYKVVGSLSAGSDRREISLCTITKKGYKFTVRPIE